MTTNPETDHTVQSQEKKTPIIAVFDGDGFDLPDGSYGILEPGIKLNRRRNKGTEFPLIVVKNNLDGTKTVKIVYEENPVATKELCSHGQEKNFCPQCRLGDERLRLKACTHEWQYTGKEVSCSKCGHQDHTWTWSDETGQSVCQLCDMSTTQLQEMIELYRHPERACQHEWTPTVFDGRTISCAKCNHVIHSFTSGVCECRLTLEEYERLVASIPDKTYRDLETIADQQKLEQSLNLDTFIVCDIDDIVEKEVIPISQLNGIGFLSNDRNLLPDTVSPVDFVRYETITTHSPGSIVLSPDEYGTRYSDWSQHVRVAVIRDRNGKEFYFVRYFNHLYRFYDIGSNIPTKL